MTRDEIIKAAERLSNHLERWSPNFQPEGRNNAEIVRSLIVLVPKEGMVERIEEADRIILQLTMTHCSNPEYEKGFEMAAVYFHKYKEKP